MINFQKIFFINRQRPALSAQNLNQMQTNTENALNEADLEIQQMGLSKQDKLIGTQTTGQNIKTINGQNIMGTGDLQIDTGKIDKIKVQGIEQEIVDKEVDLDVPTMEQIYDLMPNGTATGENIHITDSSNLKAEVKGFGNTKQNTTTGANIYYMDYNDNTQNWNGVTIISTKTGYSISGTATASGGYTLISRKMTLSAGTYTMLLNKPTTLSKVGLSRTDYTNVGRILKGEISKTFTLSAETDVCLSIEIINGETYNEENEIMIYLGTAVKPFEPYTGGIPSPNPQYKQDIETIKAQNIFDKNTMSTRYYRYIASVTEWLTANDSYSIAIPCKSNTTYTISHNNNSETMFRCGFIKETIIPSSGNITIYNGFRGTTEKTHIINAVEGSTYIIIQFGAGNILNTLNTLMVYEGTEIKTYLPYGCIEEKVVGKNLYKIMAKTNRGISATYNENTGVLSYNGTPTGSYADITEAFYTNLPSGNLNVKIDNPQSSVGVQIRGWYIDGTTTEARINPGSLSVTLPVAKQLYQLRMFLTNLTVGTAVSGSFKFMVSKDGGEIEQYQENTSIINLQGNEMVKLSDAVKDELNVDINGNAKLTKNIGKVVLDGTENWKLSYSGTNNWFYYFTTSFGIKDENILPISDYYIGNKIASNNDLKGIWITNSKQLRIREMTEDTIANFKARLVQHPVTVYYELETPQVIDLGKVTPLHTYKNVSNITALTNIPMNMEIKYKKDLETIINSLS